MRLGNSAEGHNMEHLFTAALGLDIVAVVVAALRFASLSKA